MNQHLYPGEFLLHQKYAATPMLLDLIWTHCNIIAEVATDLLDRGTFDKSELPRELVIQACLLHDIGTYACSGFEWIPNQPPSTKPYIQHGIIGAWLLQQEGYHQHVVQAAYCHIGVGLSVEDIRSHGISLPEHDFTPHTPLQRFMTYVSKFHSKAPKFRTGQQIQESLAKFSQEKANAFAELATIYGAPDLANLEEKYKEWHRTFTFKVNQLTQGLGVNLHPSGVNLG